MHFFYLPQLDIQHPILPDEEAHHAIKVLRLQQDDRILITDGKGSLHEAAINDYSQRHCTLAILSSERFERPAPLIHVAIAPTKNSDRLEWFIEKATEIGISRITPILCQHSERRIQKPERLEKVMVAALKQSQQSWMPVLDKTTALEELLKTAVPGQKFIAHCKPKQKRPLLNSYSPGQDALLLIGPEGDFSEPEIEAAIQAGFQPVSLGENRLRTETAALVGLVTLQLKNAE